MPNMYIKRLGSSSDKKDSDNNSFNFNELLKNADSSVNVSVPVGFRNSKGSKSEIPAHLPFEYLEKDYSEIFPKILRNSVHKPSKSEITDLNIDMVKVLNNIVMRIKEKNESLKGKLSKKKRKVLDRFIKCICIIIHLVHSEHNIVVLNKDEEGKPKSHEISPRSTDKYPKHPKKGKKLSIVPLSQSSRNTSTKFFDFKRSKFYNDFLIQELEVEQLDNLRFRGRRFKTRKEDMEFLTMFDNINDDILPKKKAISSKSNDELNVFKDDEDFKDDFENENGNSFQINSICSNPTPINKDSEVEFKPFYINDYEKYENDEEVYEMCREEKSDKVTCVSGQEDVIINKSHRFKQKSLDIGSKEMPIDSKDKDTSKECSKDKESSNKDKDSSIKDSLKEVQKDIYKKKRNKSSFFNSEDLKMIPIFIPIRLDQIEQQSPRESKNISKGSGGQEKKLRHSKTHLFISPDDNKLSIKTLSEDTIINDVDLNFNIEEVEVNLGKEDSTEKENQDELFSKINIVSINEGKRRSKEKKNSMTINELLKLIRKKSMEGLSITNEINLNLNK